MNETTEPVKSGPCRTRSRVPFCEPVLYFQNTQTYAYHYDFVVEALGWDIDLETFNLETYFRDGRCNLAGSLIAYDDYVSSVDGQGIYGLEFWPTDPVSFELVALAYDKITEAVPFAADKTFYHPAGETQRALYQRDQDQYENSDVRVIQTEDLFAEIRFAAMNPGEAYGHLRIMDSVMSTSIRDIVLFKTLPNALGHVAGIITEVPQTPLSHVNLKAKQNDTPNAYICDASEDPNILQWADSYVHYVVTASGYTIAWRRLRPNRSMPFWRTCVPT